MSALKISATFDQIYNSTYNDLLKFVIFKCDRIDDVNDIIQDTYIELYKIMEKRDIEDIKPFIIGIAKNKIKKYFTLKSKVQKLFTSTSFDEELLNNQLPDNFNLEKKIIDKITSEEIWSYLNDKSQIITKIFYLYYAEGLTIKEIAHGLKLNESLIKNHLYRTLKELKVKYRKEHA